MNGTAKPRVYVGADGSLSGLRALRQAAAEARYPRAELHVVRVRDALPGSGGLFATVLPAPGDAGGDCLQLDNEADALITDSLQSVFGGPPSGVAVRRVVLVGRPAKALAAVAEQADGLLVVGTDGGSRWRHPLRRSASTYCIRHARCPVLVVPPDEFARTVRRRMRYRRSLLPRHPWSEFDAVTEGKHQHAV